MATIQCLRSNFVGQHLRDVCENCLAFACEELKGLLAEAYYMTDTNAIVYHEVFSGAKE